MDVPFNVLQWAAEECDRQKSGEYSVYRMCRAWAWLKTEVRNRAMLTIEDIKILAEMLEPDKNMGGQYRIVPVTFKNNTSPAIHHSLIEDRMKGLITHQPTVDQSLDESYITLWYEEFEICHPFIDGNGRLGSILYNFYRGSLDQPTAPPDVFSNEKANEQ